MMIEKHISALLYRYQCVTVPGFGAFLTETRTAVLDADTHTFYPPKKLISFNANVKNNDGLLASHIALQEKISYEQAVATIEQAAEGWMARLRTGQLLSIKNLGEMKYNTEGSLVFTPDTPVNYLTDAFGLSAVVSPAVKREEMKQAVEALGEKAPIIFTPERRGNKYASLVKYAAVFALLAGGGTALKITRDNQIAEETLVVERNVQEKLQQKIQQATFFIENPMPAVKLPLREEVQNLPYHVVAAAFQSVSNADKAVRQLGAKGYKARRLEKNKAGLYPVSYSSFATYSEAYKNMMDIRHTENKDAWLMVQ